MRFFAFGVLLVITSVIAAIRDCEDMEEMVEMMDVLANPCIYCHFLYRDCLSVSENFFGIFFLLVCLFPTYPRSRVRLGGGFVFFFYHRSWVWRAFTYTDC